MSKIKEYFFSGIMEKIFGAVHTFRDVHHSDHHERHHDFHWKWRHWNGDSNKEDSDESAKVKNKGLDKKVDIQDDYFTGDEDTVIFGNVLANDSITKGKNTLSVSAATFTTANGGTVVLNEDGSFTYTPALNFDGADSFEYQALYNNYSETGTVNITINNVSVMGTDGNDVIANTATGDEVYTLGGNDTIIVGTGTAKIDGGTGNDTLSFENLSLGINASIGRLSATIDGVVEYTFLAIENLTGTQFDDYLTGNSGANILVGNAGNDVLLGREGNDSLIGGDGNDTLYGNDGNDYLSGGAGVDILFGDGISGTTDTGADTIFGGDGDDKLYGGNGDDALHGDAGNDILYGDIIAATDTYTGNDRLWGGDGDDRLYGNSGNDRFDGGDGSDYLYGGTGNDILLGGAGNDYLYGDEGNDILSGGLGRDSLYGGAGADTFLFKPDSAFADMDIIRDINFAEGDTIDVSQLLIGYDPLTSNALKYVLITQVSTFSYLRVDADGAENGSDFTHIIARIDNTGNLSLSELLANGSLILGGSDTIYGDNGNNTLTGTNGSDLLYGGAGNDTLYGGAGDDILYGEQGADHLYGGAGADTFHFQSASSSSFDIIHDFNASEGDMIVISDLLSNFDPLTDTLSDFVITTEANGYSYLRADIDGATNGHDFSQVVAVVEGTGLNLETLLDNGNLII